MNNDVIDSDSESIDSGECKSPSNLPNARDVFHAFFVGRDKRDAEEAEGRTAVVKCKKTVEASAAGDKTEVAI